MKIYRNLETRKLAKACFYSGNNHQEINELLDLKTKKGSDFLLAGFIKIEVGEWVIRKFMSGKNSPLDISFEVVQDKEFTKRFVEYK